LDTAERLEQHGLTAAVVDPRWVLPVPASLARLARDFRLVVTVEDGGMHGGVGSAVSSACGRPGSTFPPVNSVCRNGSWIMRHGNRSIVSWG
ncbi:hypothetical protein GQ85_26185, partial [Rhodococcus rhodochrous]